MMQTDDTTATLAALRALDDSRLDTHLHGLLHAVQPRHDDALAQQLQRRIDQLTKPLGALGQLETLALRIGLLQGTPEPALQAPQLIVFAADHGLARQRVSAYPQAVTRQMVANMRAGGAAVNVLARQHGLALTLVDAGVMTEAEAQAAEADAAAALADAAARAADTAVHSAADAAADTAAPMAAPIAAPNAAPIAARPATDTAAPSAGAAGSSAPAPTISRALIDVVDARLGAGTADASVQAAMSARQARLALACGAAVLARAPGNALLLGELGIGNTASAALLVHRLAGVPLDVCTGRGSGLDDTGLAHKRAVLQRAVERAPLARAPLEVLAEFGGFEIGMMAGAVLQAAAQRRLVLVDGYIAGAAVLLAARLAPAVLEACVFAHRSAESGHRALLAQLGAQPLVDLGLRLGEGSGAALAWPMVVSALKLYRQMASFASAGVSTRAD